MTKTPRTRRAKLWCPVERQGEGSQRVERKFPPTAFPYPHLSLHSSFIPTQEYYAAVFQTQAYVKRFGLCSCREWIVHIQLMGVCSGEKFKWCFCGPGRILKGILLYISLNVIVLYCCSQAFSSHPLSIKKNSPNSGTVTCSYADRSPPGWYSRSNVESQEDKGESQL